MPEHASKRRSTSNNAQSTGKASQDDKHAKEQVKTSLSDPKDSVIIGQDPASDVAVDGSRETVIEEKEDEVPKPPYDAMRVEPVLTKLIVEKHEGEVDEFGFFQGEASISFVGGHWYTGTIKDRKMNGQGVYCWADGTVFRGEFLENCITGNGIYSWPDGSVYEGEVKNGLRHGMGTYKCGTCPSMYIGEWVNGTRHGRGALYFDKNCECYYDGEWNNGTKEGYGVHKFKSGNIYEGQWLENLRHGQGKMHWFDRGEEYDGEWTKGVQNGRGKHTWYLKRIAVSQYPVRNEYEGSFSNGQRNGYGIFNYASGARYSGYWSKNLKSGRGEFMFKNGSTFKGMFENDHIVDFPDLIPSGMTTPDIAESGLPVRSQTPLQDSSPDMDTGSIDALLSINLKEIAYDEKFDIERQQLELDELVRVVLRYMTPVKQVYKFYSSIGIVDNADNTFVMNRVQFWRFLKDCMLHTVGRTLAEIDQVDGISESNKDKHECTTKIYVRDFVNVLINVSYFLFKADFPNESPAIANCLLKMLTKFVFPNAFTIKGYVFSRHDYSKEALNYMQKCEEIFNYFRAVCLNHHNRETLRLRDFLWILKEFKLIDDRLTVSKFLNAFYSGDEAVLEDRCFNLENSIVFLEFFETLILCSQYFTADTSNTTDEGENTNNIALDSTEIKSPTLMKDGEELVTAEPGPEQLQKSLTNVQSPEKGVPTTTGTEQISSREQLKHESTQPSSKTQDSHPHNKTSAGRKDPPAPKEGTSVAPGSRNKRRGTIENAEPDGKVGNSSTTKSKEKGAREKEKSKSGGKSAKKVNIEENKEKHIYSNTSVPVSIDQEREDQSAAQLDASNIGVDNSTNRQSTNTVIEGDAHTLTDGAREVPQIIDNSKENQDSAQSIIPTAVVDNGNTGSDAKDDDDEVQFQIWASNLRSFFENHFFPAFELRRRIDDALDAGRGTSLLN